MISSVTHATQADPTVAAAQTQAAAPPQKPTESKPAASKPSAEPKDTVQISAAAQALQEASETPQQTAKEAQGGDQQAKRLVAQQAAAEKALQ